MWCLCRGALGCYPSRLLCRLRQRLALASNPLVRLCHHLKMTHLFVIWGVDNLELGFQPSLMSLHPWAMSKLRSAVIHFMSALLNLSCACLSDAPFRTK